MSVNTFQKCHTPFVKKSTPIFENIELGLLWRYRTSRSTVHFGGIVQLSIAKIETQ